jgi:acyl-CoA thioesterase I
MPRTRLGTPLASFRSSRLRRAIEERRRLSVLALGPPSVGGGGLAPYPVRLEHELEKVLPGVDVTVQGRSLLGDVTFTQLALS